MKAFRFLMFAGMGFLFISTATAQDQLEKYIPTSAIIVPQRIVLCPAFSINQTCISGNFMLRLPARYNINSVANLFAGVNSVNGARPSIRGSRPDATAYYIDGVRMIDFDLIPMPYTYQDCSKLNRQDHEVY